MSDTNTPYRFHDGGRAAAGFQGQAGDCFTRAIAIASGRPYRDIYDEVAALVGAATGKRSARNGVPTKVMRSYMDQHGWSWTPTMGIGTGCQIHLNAAELPGGVLVARVTRHVVAVIDGIIYDTHDPTRAGTRCVYGYWTPPNPTIPTVW